MECRWPGKISWQQSKLWEEKERRKTGIEIFEKMGNNKNEVVSNLKKNRKGEERRETITNNPKSMTGLQMIAENKLFLLISEKIATVCNYH